MTHTRVTELIRNPTTAAGIAAVTVDLRTINGDTLVDSQSTNSDGVAKFMHEDVMYPGPVYSEATVGATERARSGLIQGQLGGLIWTDDINDFFSVFGSGVAANIENEFAVSASGSNLTATIGTGLAVLKDGLVYYQDVAQNVTFTTPHATLPRIDRVVLRVTREGQTDQGKIELALLTGTAAASPTVPALTQSAATWDFPLYSIQHSGGATTVSTGSFSSDRVFLLIPDIATTPTVGALYYVAANGKLTKLSIGTSGQVLKSTGTIPSWSSVTVAAGDLPTGIDAAKIANGTVSNAEFQYIGTLTSNAQSQLTTLASNITTLDVQKADVSGDTFTGDVAFNQDVTVTGAFRDNSSGSWTATNGSAIGTSPGTMTKDRNEYAGRIVQTTGSGGTTPGALWNVVFANPRPTSNYIALVQGGNDETAGLMPYVSSTSTTGFTIACVGDPPNSTSLRVSWFIIDCA